MQTGAALTTQAAYPATVTDAPAQAYQLLLEDSRSEQTRRAYRADLRDFCKHMGADDVTPSALRSLCTLETGALALTLNGYKGAMRERGLAEATINRRLAAVRALLRMARRLGADCPDPAGLVTSEKVRPYRDTRGPELQAARRLLAAPDRGTVRGKRDYALLLVLCENALRRGELVACDVRDFDPAGRRLHIIGKGHGTQREPVTLSDAAVAALTDYLNARHTPPADAPLFVNVSRDPAAGGARLSGRGLALVVEGYGKQVLGTPLHPHALRHMAITAYLDLSAGDVRGAQRLSRHASLLTLQKYDDNRADLQGRATGLLSALLHGA
jgi:integrase/recombinase XerC